MRSVFGFALLLATVFPLWSASKPHVVFLGKPQPAKVSLDKDEAQTLTISVRGLYVDNKLKEFTTGSPHDVTDRLFVVQRAFRMNDSLPGDNPKQLTSVWQLGGWLLVDRATGHVTQVRLPDFDPTCSKVSWYRDYAAYFGASDTGERWYAEVAQIGVKKAVFRKEIGKSSPASEAPGCKVSAPQWERRPPRVTFSPSGAEKFTVNVVTRHAIEEPAEDAAE